MANTGLIWRCHFLNKCQKSIFSPAKHPLPCQALTERKVILTCHVATCLSCPSPRIQQATGLVKLPACKMLAVGVGFSSNLVRSKPGAVQNVGTKTSKA